MMDELALAVRLQSLDRKSASLELEIATLPKQIAEIERKLEAHKRRLEADRAALTANQRDVKKLEAEIQIQEQKISKLRDQMLQAKTNEQYRAFQNEISWCENEIRKSEDRILELMEQSEPLEKSLKAAEVALKKETELVESEKNRARQKTAADKKELQELATERADITSKISSSLYHDYERIRRKTKGIVFAEVVDGHCEACMISLRPQFLQELKVGDKIMHCESCGRILIYNPPVSFENSVGPAATTA
jgi:predicted  nucleic acid-binding Zn-ribbon protein